MFVSFSGDINVLLLGMSRETFLFMNEKSNFRPRASSVWIAIYTLMTRNGFKKVSPSLEILCQMTGQSQSTVQRGLRELVEKSYLTYSPMYANSGKWGVNYYTCLLPGKTIPETQEKKPYVHYMPEKDSWDELLSCHSEYVAMMQEERIANNEQKSIQSTKVDHHSIFQSSVINKHNIQCEIFSKDEQKSFLEVIEKEKSFLESLSIKKNELEERMRENMIDRFTVKDTGVAFALMQEHCEIISLQNNAGVNLKYHEDLLRKMLELEKQKDEILTNESFLAEKSWKRQISKGLLWWIKKQLYKMGVKKDEMALRLNEISHTVIFGSLSHVKYMVHESMPIMKSVNICLKLIREGKWQSPASFCNGEAIYG